MQHRRDIADIVACCRVIVCSSAVRTWLVSAVSAGVVILITFCFIAGCGSPGLRMIEPNCPQALVAAGFPAGQPLQDYQRVLEEFVQDDGRIDYRSLADSHQGRRRLDCFLSWVAKTNPQDNTILFTDDNRRTAFYLNAYNASVLRAILEFYPLRQLNDCPVDFLTEVFLTVGSERFSLTSLAQRCLEPGDWRVAFALAGPTLSDPPLTRQPYRPELLDKQLDTAVAGYLGGCAGLQIDHARRRVLFGELVYHRRHDLIEGYGDHFKQSYAPDDNVSLITAVIPWSAPQTAELLADVVGYGAGPLRRRDRINDIEPPNWLRDEDDDEEFLPCGCR